MDRLFRAMITIRIQRYSGTQQKRKPARAEKRGKKKKSQQRRESTIDQCLDIRIPPTAISRERAHAILREYVHTARPHLKPNRAFLRMEAPPGERFEVDWAHFGVLDYAGDKRKFYAFALVEAHSRMLYLEFTHSQTPPAERVA
jgi:transposase